MTDFISIKEAKVAMKGNVVVTAMSISDLVAGSKDGKDWTRKTIRLEDSLDSVELTAWNDEIKLFEYGGVYKIEKGWWQEYNGNVTLNLGQYATVTKLESGMKPESALPAKTLETIPEPNGFFTDTVDAECLVLLQIETRVKKFLNTYEIDPNGQKIGMHVKEIYRKISKSNFTKASEMEQ